MQLMSRDIKPNKSFKHIKREAELVSVTRSIDNITSSFNVDYAYFSESAIKNIVKNLAEGIIKIFGFIVRLIKTVLNKLTGGRLFSGTEEGEHSAKLAAHAVSDTLESIMNNLGSVQIQTIKDYQEYERVIHDRVDDIEFSEKELKNLEMIRNVNLSDLESKVYTSALNKEFNRLSNLNSVEDLKEELSRVSRITTSYANFDNKVVEKGNLLADDILRNIPTTGDMSKTEVKELILKFFRQTGDKSSLISNMKKMLRDDVYLNQKEAFSNEALMLLYSNDLTDPGTRIDRALGRMINLLDGLNEIWYDAIEERKEAVRNDEDKTIQDILVEKKSDRENYLEGFKNKIDNPESEFIGDKLKEAINKNEVIKDMPSTVKDYEEYINNTEATDIIEVLEYEKRSKNQFLFQGKHYLELNDSLENLRKKCYYRLNERKDGYFSDFLNSLNEIKERNEKLSEYFEGDYEDIFADISDGKLMNELSKSVNSIASIIMYINTLAEISKHQLSATLAHESIKKYTYKIFLIKFILSPIINYNLENNESWREYHYREDRL